MNIEKHTPEFNDKKDIWIERRRGDKVGYKVVSNLCTGVREIDGSPLRQCRIHLEWNWTSESYSEVVAVEAGLGHDPRRNRQRVYQIQYQIRKKSSRFTHTNPKTIR